MAKKTSRRNFMIKSSALATASLLPVSGFSHTNTKVRKYKIGLQLFTIRDAMEKDALDSLSQVRELGYEDLEIYGFDAKNGTYYGYQPSEFRKILDDRDLTTSSGHYDLPSFYDQPETALLKYVDQCIEGAHVLGQDYITWPWLDPKFRNIDGFKKLADLLNKIGEQVVKGGLKFAYHNHGFEFEDHQGQTGYEIILSKTDPELVKLQLDLYWVKHSSMLSPEQWIAKQPGRYEMWHIKDMDKTTRDYTELGNGSIDFHPILPEAQRSGLKYYYLEQGSNFAVNSMQSIADSLAYFKEHLIKYL